MISTIHKVYWRYSTTELVRHEKGRIVTHKDAESTKCFIVNINKSDEVMGVGEAICAPEDHASKEYGRKLSFSRAIKAIYGEGAEFRQVRKQLWEAYRTMGGSTR